MRPSNVGWDLKLLWFLLKTTNWISKCDETTLLHIISAPYSPCPEQSNSLLVEQAGVRPRFRKLERIRDWWAHSRHQIPAKTCSYSIYQRLQASERNWAHTHWAEFTQQNNVVRKQANHIISVCEEFMNIMMWQNIYVADRVIICGSKIKYIWTNDDISE